MKTIYFNKYCKLNIKINISESHSNHDKEKETAQ